MNKIFLNKNSKEMLDDISALLGVKSDIVKAVWEFTLISWLLKYSESDSKVKQITVPYLGTIGIRYNGESISNDNDNISGEFDVYVALSENFKSLLHSVEINSSKEISEMLQEKIKQIATSL